MTLKGAGSATEALRRSLLVGLTLLWLTGVVGSGIVLKHLIDERSDDELQESGTILMSLLSDTDDLIITATLLGEHPAPANTNVARENPVYQIRDAAGGVLVRSHGAPPELAAAPLVIGLADVVSWRVATLKDPGRQRFLQIADPLSERRDALFIALLWLTVPLAGLLAFAAFMVFRASRVLASQVERTAHAVSRQDPQALSLLPLDGVVTELRPAVEATNQLLGRLADALEAERSFTYNSAHELRTPISAALAQSQLLAAMADQTPLREAADALVGALSRLARLAERLLALARAEGAEPLDHEWVDLARVVRLTFDEFGRDPRLLGRQLATEALPARVRGDLDAVGLAVRNLLENALVHGAGGTMIRLTCGAVDNVTTLAVIDDGPGVKKTEISSLTKRFARGSAAHGSGAGLGLSIVDTLARRMGAELVLVSPVEGQRAGLEARLVWPARLQRAAIRSKATLSSSE